MLLRARARIEPGLTEMAGETTDGLLWRGAAVLLVIPPTINDLFTAGTCAGVSARMTRARLILKVIRGVIALLAFQLFDSVLELRCRMAPSLRVYRSALPSAQPEKSYSKRGWCGQPHMIQVWVCVPIIHPATPRKAPGRKKSGTGRRRADLRLRPDNFGCNRRGTPSP